MSGKQQGHELAMEVLKRIAARYENCSVNIYPDMPHLTPVEAVLRCAAEEGFKLVQELPPAHIANLPSEGTKPPCKCGKTHAEHQELEDVAGEKMHKICHTYQPAAAPPPDNFNGIPDYTEYAENILKEFALPLDGERIKELNYWIRNAVRCDRRDRAAAPPQEPEAGLEGALSGEELRSLCYVTCGLDPAWMKDRWSKLAEKITGHLRARDAERDKALEGLALIADRWFSARHERAGIETLCDIGDEMRERVRALIASQKEGASNPVQPTDPPLHMCKCGHDSRLHGSWDGAECTAGGCDCMEFKDASAQAAGSTRQAHAYLPTTLDELPGLDDETESLDRHSLVRDSFGPVGCSCGKWDAILLDRADEIEAAWQAHVAGSTRQAHRRYNLSDGLLRCECGQLVMDVEEWQAHVAASTRQAPEGGE